MRLAAPRSTRLPPARVADFDDPLAPNPALTVHALTDLGLSVDEIVRYLGVDRRRVHRLQACGNTGSV
jgi:hypothetical protein